MFASLIFNKPCIISDRGRAFPGVIENPWFSTLMGEVLRRADKIEIREKDMGFFRSLGVPKGRLTLLDTMTNPENFVHDGASFDFTPYMPVESKKGPVLTFLDTPEPQRKFQALLEAAAEVRERDFLVAVLLNRSPETMVRELRERAAACGLEEKLMVIPPQPPWKLASLIKSSASVIYPGVSDDYESPFKFIRLPYLMEALLCGTCVVLSTDLYRKTRYTHLKDGEHLLLFAHGQAGGLASRMKSIIDDAAAAQGVGSRARDSALRTTEYPEIFQQKLVMYREVCEHFAHNQEKELKIARQGPL